jgi:hypothetical protein
VVDSQITALNRARFAALNWLASSVVSTVKFVCRAELLDRGDPGRDGVVPESGGLAEHQHREVRGLRGNGGQSGCGRDDGQQKGKSAQHDRLSRFLSSVVQTGRAPITPSDA